MASCVDTRFDLKCIIEEYRRSMRPEMGVKVSSFRDQFMIDGGGCATPIGAINFASGAKIHIYSGPRPNPVTDHHFAARAGE